MPAVVIIGVWDKVLSGMTYRTWYRETLGGFFNVDKHIPKVILFAYDVFESLGVIFLAR